MKPPAAVTMLVLAACAGGVSSAKPASAPATRPIAAQHRLYASPRTVAWGNYDAAATPVLRIKPGDVVEVYTLLTSNPTTLKNNGVDSAAIEPALRAVYDSVPRTARGPGGHILTGPIFIEGADSGDVLEVRILSVDLAIPYAYNSFGGRGGFIPEDFGYSRTKIIPLDAAKGVAHDDEKEQRLGGHQHRPHREQPLEQIRRIKEGVWPFRRQPPLEVGPSMRAPPAQ